MALIKCTECGHEVSDRASACPNCGCPIEKGNCCIECGQPIPDGVNECPNCGCPTQDNLTHDFESAKKSKNGLIWLISILALSVLLGGGYYLFDKANGTAREKVDKVNIDSLLADGHYTFKGNWESSRHSAQPCKVEFEKKGGILENCAYTNLKYDTRIPLNGTIQNDTLHFVGDISGKQLVINLKIASDGDMLIGEGIDYAHSGDKAILKLTKISSGEEKVENEDNSEQESIVVKKEIERRAIIGTYYFNPCKDNYASVDMYDGQKWWKERKLVGYIKWSEYIVVMEDLRVSLLEPNRKSFVGNVTDIKDGVFVISVNSSENATVGAWTPLYKNGREIGRLGNKGYGFPKNIVIDTQTRRIYNGVNDYMNRDISDVEYIMYDRYSSTIEDSNNTEYERTYLSEKYEREYGR